MSDQIPQVPDIGRFETDVRAILVAAIQRIKTEAQSGSGSDDFERHILKDWLDREAQTDE